MPEHYVSSDPKDLGRFLRMIAAAVMQRGGRVEVSFFEIPALLHRAMMIRGRDEQSIGFVLLPPDKKLRDISTYQDRLRYRADVVMKYLIATSPGQRLVVTAAQLTALGKFRLHLDGDITRIFATVNEKVTEGASEDRTFVLEDDGLVTLVPLEPKNQMA